MCDGIGKVLTAPMKFDQKVMDKVSIGRKLGIPDPWNDAQRALVVQEERRGKTGDAARKNMFSNDGGMFMPVTSYDDKSNPKPKKNLLPSTMLDTRTGLQIPYQAPGG